MSIKICHSNFELFIEHKMNAAKDSSLLLNRLVLYSKLSLFLGPVWMALVGLATGGGYDSLALFAQSGIIIGERDLVDFRIQSSCSLESVLALRHPLWA
jgi:hypothetical protein